MLDLFLAELRRSWIIARRYPMDLVSGLGLMVIIFYGIFLGARYVSGPAIQFGERLDALILGYWLWSLVLFSVNGIAMGLETEAETGTLEQVFMSPFGAVRVLVTRAFASLGLYLGTTLVLLLALLLLTSRRLEFPPALLLPLASTLLGAYGLGFGMAALSLLAKRVNQLLSLAQFLLLVLVVLPVETWSGPLAWLGALLPIAPGSGMLRDLMVRHRPLETEPVIAALLGGSVYLLLGLRSFRFADRQARRRGLLGQH